MYRLQGVKINDKHIEVILRQMIRRVIVTDSGDSDLIVGEQLEKSEVLTINDGLLSDNKKTLSICIFYLVLQKHLYQLILLFLRHLSKKQLEF